MTIDRETRTEILRLYHAEKWKIGTIARQLGVHHGTVRRVLRDAEKPRQRKPRRSKLDPFIPFIQQTLKKYPKLPASQLGRETVNALTFKLDQSTGAGQRRRAAEGLIGAPLGRA